MAKANSSLMFPIFIAEKNKELPKEGTYYVVSRNKFYLHKDTGIVKALVEVDSISMLGDLEPYVQLRLPKLPPDIICRAYKFFGEVYKSHHSEAAVTLHYNPQDQTYYMHCPEQQVSHAAVHYDLDDRFENYQLVGTIHSHCDFGAFHSGTDIHDELDQDGVHITLGHVNTKYFSASGSLVVNGTRFEVELEHAALGVRRVTMQDAVKNPNIVPLHHQNRYEISLTEEEISVVDATYGDEIKEWVRTRVNKQNYGGGNVGRGWTGGGGASGGSGGGGTNAHTTTQTQTSTPSGTDTTFTWRFDPTNKVENRKGWFNDKGVEMNPTGEPTQTTTTEVAESVEEWDADKILEDHDLLDSSEVESGDIDFSEQAYNQEKGEENDPDFDEDLADLTLKDEDEIPDAEVAEANNEDKKEEEKGEEKDG